MSIEAACIKKPPPGIAWRLALASLSLMLAVAGGQRMLEGWRLEPLEAYVHAAWWDLPQPALPSRMQDWQPESRNGRAWAAFSQAALDNANASPGPATVGQARAAVETALMLAPAQAAAWARLSLLRLNQGDRAGANQALALSFVAGPENPALAWLRSRMGLFLWEGLPARVKAGVAGDLRHLWRQPASAGLPYPQDALVRFAHGIRRLDAVREALPIGEHALLAERIKSVLKETAGAS